MNIKPNTELKLSSNRVQQSFIRWIFTQFERSHDDDYDVANFIAALRKSAHYLETAYTLYCQENGYGDFRPSVMDAEMDWVLNNENNNHAG